MRNRVRARVRCALCIHECACVRVCGWMVMRLLLRLCGTVDSHGGKKTQSNKQGIEQQHDTLTRGYSNAGTVRYNDNNTRQLPDHGVGCHRTWNPVFGTNGQVCSRPPPLAHTPPLPSSRKRLNTRGVHSIGEATTLDGRCLLLRGTCVHEDAVSDVWDQPRGVALHHRDRHKGGGVGG